MQDVRAKFYFMNLYKLNFLNILTLALKYEVPRYNAKKTLYDLYVGNSKSSRKMPSIASHTCDPRICEVRIGILGAEGQSGLYSKILSLNWVQLVKPPILTT